MGYALGNLSCCLYSAVKWENWIGTDLGSVRIDV